MYRSTGETMARLKSPRTIGYFGDSFCANTTHNSWTIKLADALSCDITNFGVDGSSIWTPIIEYNKRHKEGTLPDIVIFCWTNPHRMYHPKQPATLSWALENSSNLSDAIKKYFTYLWFDEKELLNYKYTLEHFDQHVLSAFDGKILQIFSTSPNDNNLPVAVDLKKGFINNFSLLNFSGLTLDEHAKSVKLRDETFINHMTAEKNSDLADYFYKKLAV